MESVTKYTGFLSTRTQSAIRRSFRNLAHLIYGNKALSIVLGILLIIICLSGGRIYNAKVCVIDSSPCIEHRLNYLWIPQRSPVWSQYTNIIDKFGSYPTGLRLLLTTSNENESILSPANMDIAFEVMNSIHNVTLHDHYGRDYEYTDLCVRSSSAQPHCDSDTESFFAVFFQNNPLYWSNENRALSILNDNIPNLPISLQIYLGAIQYDDDDDPTRITGAHSLWISFSVEGGSNETLNNIVYEYAGAFNEYWYEHVFDYEDHIEIAPYSVRLLNEEVARNVEQDFPTFVAAFWLMLFYLMFTLGTCSCVGARPWLALSALILLLGALTIGFNIALCLGFAFNTFVLMVPFILLGVDVNDMNRSWIRWLVLCDQKAIESRAQRFEIGIVSVCHRVHDQLAC